MHRNIFGFLMFLPFTISAQWSSHWLDKNLIEKKGVSQIYPAVLPENASWMPIINLNQSVAYQLYYRGFPVRGNQLAVLYFSQRALVSAQYDRKMAFMPISDLPAGNAEWISTGLYQPYRLFHYRDSAGYRFFRSADTAFCENQYRYASKDTSVQAYVFLPDPLSRANMLYGGSYKDGHDFNYPELAAQMVEKTLAVQFENDSFFLKNDWLSFKEISLPIYTEHATSKSKDFKYNRSQAPFEEVNIFFHLLELSKWWDSLGFAQYIDTVEIDAHAFSGAEESAMNPLVTPVTIEFGDGGVDDGEDADVAIHEMTHVAFNKVIPNSYNGTQRQSIEEGICNFMALAYSLKYTSNQPGWVYNWDGHNEFWSGRNLNNQKIFPIHITNQPPVDAELFGAALYDLGGYVGFDSAVALVMRTMPLMVSGINMREAALLLLQVDSAANGGRMHWDLVKALWPHGLLPSASLADLPQKTMMVKNTEAFALGIGNASVSVAPYGELQIFDVRGRWIRTITAAAQPNVSLNPADFPSGIYLLRCGEFAARIAKF